MKRSHSRSARTASGRGLCRQRQSTHASWYPGGPLHPSPGGQHAFMGYTFPSRPKAKRAAQACRRGLAVADGAARRHHAGPVMNDAAPAAAAARASSRWRCVPEDEVDHHADDAQGEEREHHEYGCERLDHLHPSLPEAPRKSSRFGPLGQRCRRLAPSARREGATVVEDRTLVDSSPWFVAGPSGRSRANDEEERWKPEPHRRAKASSVR